MMTMVGCVSMTENSERPTKKDTVIEATRTTTAGSIAPEPDIGTTKTTAQVVLATNHAPSALAGTTTPVRVIARIIAVVITRVSALIVVQ